MCFFKTHIPVTSPINTGLFEVSTSTFVKLHEINTSEKVKKKQDEYDLYQVIFLLIIETLYKLNVLVLYYI